MFSRILVDMDCRQTIRAHLTLARHVPQRHVIDNAGGIVGDAGQINTNLG
jgi:hypothetical protein